jgi:tetratricopeptide (TPR) repeat protein
VLTRVEPQTPFPEVPAELAEDPDILFLRADAMAVRREWSAAEELFRKVIALPTFDVIAKSRLAEVILMETTGGRFYGGVPYAPNDAARLTEALALLDEAWSGLKHNGRSAPAVQALQNACAIRAAFGRIREAEAAIDEGLSIAPDVPALLVWKIRLASTRGDGAAALRTLDRLSPDAVEDYRVIAASAPPLSLGTPAIWNWRTTRAACSRTSYVSRIWCMPRSASMRCRRRAPLP